MRAGAVGVQALRLAAGGEEGGHFRARQHATIQLGAPEAEAAAVRGAAEDTVVENLDELAVAQPVNVLRTAIGFFT